MSHEAINQQDANHLAASQGAVSQRGVSQEVKVYKVWDRPTRLFHWINLGLVMVLIFIGMVMLFKADIGISGLEAKIGLKKLHVWVGYLFAINLSIRLIWGVIGSHSARLSQFLPDPKGLSRYKAKLAKGGSPQYLHHNPLGRLAIFVMMLLLVTIMLTGLVRAGTDIYYPPLGGAVSDYIAQPGVDGASIKPYDDTGVDGKKVAILKPYKSLAGKVHLYSVYLLILMIVLHIAGVIVAEIKHQPGLVSAMISGNKPLTGPAEDE
ncbi:cytochrome b/b6 domain-containing protein [Shewanella insulae]|uniref:cytochrome b/b6 domain-containing protein n=1 Tax=Shewanella insulae TaxID=2681496 RepID=UPI001EFD9F8D|nr:cytochrome b/b6 domain-containing protein [Shewanella insulae]MCG9738630.1 cytochrome b/b6 domain-containing protein [Shewanella insulae]